MKIRCTATWQSDTRTRIATSVLRPKGLSAVKPTNHPNWCIVKSISHSDSVQLSLRNDVTMQLISLPPLDRKSADCIKFVVLTEVEPDHPDCAVLMWVDYAILFCHIADVRDWNRRDYLEDEDDEEQKKMPEFEAAFVRDHDKKIFMVMDGKDFLFSRIEIAKPETLLITRLACNKPYNSGGGVSLSWNSHWVSSSFGDIFSIHVAFGGVGHKKEGYGEEIIRIMVFKLDVSDMSWNIVDNCPNIAFFISGPGLPTFAHDSIEAGNRVYILLDDYKYLFTYHIQENTIQKTPLASLLPTPHSSPPLLPYWVLISDHQNTGEVCYGETRGGDHSFVEMVKDMFIRLWERFRGEKISVSWTDLPPDMLETICSHLNNPVDYLNFRAVNKLCSFIIAPKGWKTVSDKIDVGFPWLFIPSLVEKGVSSMVDPISSNKFYLSPSSSWDHHSRTCYSSVGWLMIYSDYFSKELGKGLRLYNPMTKSTVCTVPKPEHYDNHYYFNTKPGKCAEKDECFGITMKRPSMSFGEVDWQSVALELSTEQEGNLKYVNQSNIDPAIIHRPRNTTIFFLVGQENLASIFVGGAEFVESFSFESHHFTLPCNSSYERRFLVGVGAQRLISVYIGNE